MASTDSGMEAERKGRSASLRLRGVPSSSEEGTQMAMRLVEGDGDTMDLRADTRIHNIVLRVGVSGDLHQRGGAR